MKTTTSFSLTTVFLLVVTLLPCGVGAATNELSAALQTGLFEEEANRNLPAAIEAYEKVAKQFDQNRALAATAIFRLGEVNRKQGKTNEAAAFYQRILCEFTDQDALVKLSQQNLAGMGVSSSSAPVAGTGKGYDYAVQSGDTLSKIVASYRAAGVDVTAEQVLAANPGVNASKLRVGQTLFIPGSTSVAGADTANSAALRYAEAEASMLEAEIKELEAVPEEQLQQIVLQNYPNPVLTKLHQDLLTAQQQVFAMAKTFGPQHPNYLSAHEQENAIKKQIAEQTGGVLVGLRAKRDAVNARVKILREQAAKNAAISLEKARDSLPIATVVDEEEAEIRRIQAMIQNSPDLINATSGTDSLTPLGRAGAKGQLRVAAFLLDHGANINLDGPLLKAAENGHKAMVELLVARGADLNVTDGERQTALHKAAGKGFLSVLQVLVAAKADLNVRDTSSQTPIVLAAKRGSVSVVEALLKGGADPNVPSKTPPGYGLSAVSEGRAMYGAPLHFAATRRDEAMAALLLKYHADVNVRSIYDETPLNVAAVRGQAKVVQMLLNAGADPNTEDKSGRTVLSFAAEAGQAEVVRILLAAKADPNAGKINLPLHCAVLGKNADIASDLLKAGAEVSRTSGGYWLVNGSRQSFGAESFPLELAMRDPQLDIVKLLLTHKADPNGRRGDGMPLIFSALNNAEIMKAFLDAGADPNADDGSTHHRSVLSLTSNVKVVNLLLAAGANPEASSVLINAVNDRFTQKAEALLKGGANVNARTEDGLTALHFASMNNIPEMVALLLANKADVNARDNKGMTPLDYAPGKRQATTPGGMVPLLPIIPLPGLVPGASDRGSAKAETKSVTELLQAKGGLADLPKMNQIEVIRPGSFRKVVFYKGTNDWNRFTLLDAIFNNYGYGASFGGASLRSAGVAPSFAERLAMVQNVSSASPPFPDLGRVVIVRQRLANPNQPAERIAVNLLDKTNQVDCSKDVMLEFGDVIEIPERLHTLQETAVGLTSDQMARIRDCRKGEVVLVYQGKKTPLAVASTPGEAVIGSILAGEKAREALFSSADLTQVKVTRRDAESGQPSEWIVNCSQEQTPDLWLRDGDVIEVPEKAPSIFDTDPATARAGGKVLLSGAVKASSLTLEVGKTTSVLAAVLQVGVTDVGNLKNVELQRVDPTTKQASKTVLNLEAMTQGDRSNDILLQDGDLILVQKRKIIF